MPIRLAVSELPQMLTDVVREAFAAEPDISVEVLPRDGTGDLSAAIHRAAPDVVIIGSDRGAAPSCDLLFDHPNLVVLGLSTDARTAWVCELRPHARQLGEVSLAGLRSAVREAIGRRGRGVARGIG